VLAIFLSAVTELGQDEWETIIFSHITENLASSCVCIHVWCVCVCVCVAFYIVIHQWLWTFLCGRRRHFMKNITVWDFRLSWQRVWRWEPSGMWYCESRSRPTFQRCILPPASGWWIMNNYLSPWWWSQYAPLKHRSTPTRLLGATYQKALIFKFITIYGSFFHKHWMSS
jgi:hypothetical protein